MILFYISKYVATPLYYGGDRKYTLSKYMNHLNEKVTLIFSRSNGRKHKSTWKLFKNENVDGLDTVMINGVLVKQMGINFRRMFSWLQFEMNLFLYFLLLPKSKRPDVVIASSFSLFTFYTVSLLKKIYKFKMIVEVRDISPQTELDFGRISKKSIVYKVFKYVELFGYKHADKTFATMPKFDDYLKTQGFIDKPFICIPQGFDMDNLQPLIDEPIENNSFVVTYAGTIGEVNLVEELCICAELLKNYDIEFHVYGEGTLKEILEKKYEHIDKLKFLGFVSKNEIANRLMKSDLLINMWSDKKVYDYGVSPNKWMDYMHAARPILVTYNGYKSIINEANCGWFIPANNPQLMADKILAISKMDKTYLSKIGLNGREYLIKHHDYKVLAEKLYNYINE